jgi:hypothetical protein
MNGKVKIASDKELLDVKVTIFSDAGQKVFETSFQSLKLPVEIDLSTKRLSGKYILKMDYIGLSRSFPLIFE